MLSSPDAASTQERASNLYRTLLPVHSPELKKYEHISPVLASLHWLPVKSRIDFKVLLLTYKALRLSSILPQGISCPLLPTKITLLPECSSPCNSKSIKKHDRRQSLQLSSPSSCGIIFLPQSEK